MNLSRREALILLGGTVAASGLAGCGGPPAPPAETWRRSVCRFCGVGCAVLLGFREGELVEVRGDRHAHNRGRVCIKGSILPELARLPGRTLFPQIREDGILRRASWEEAMERVALEFRAAAPAVAFYGSGQLFSEESYTANKLFKAGFRSNHVDGNPRVCMSSAAFGYVQTFGKDEPPGCYEDLDYATMLFIIGANPAECHPVLFERFKHKRMIVVDPRRTRTAEQAELFLQIQPGTDLLLLNAMAHVIVNEGFVDHAFVGANCDFEGTDFEGYRRFLVDYAPDAVAAECGLSAASIRQAATLFSRSEATTSLWTMGMNQRTQGVSLNRTIHALHLLTGQICRLGATPLSLTGQGNACGGVRDTGTLAHALPAGRLIANPEHRAEMEKFWGAPIDPTPGYDTMEMFRALGDGRLKAALIMATNPLQTLPDLNSVRKNAFIAIVEPFENTATSAYADVILPAALWIEKEGVYGQTERRYQLIERHLNPPGEARSDLQILVDLADRTGHGELIRARTPEAVWNEWRECAAPTYYNFKGITYERLRKERGLQWPCPDEKHPGTKRRYVGGDDPFAKNPVDFYGRPNHRAQIHLGAYRPVPEQTSAKFPLILTTGRVLEQWHSGTITDRIPEIASATGRGRAHLHPLDARRYGIRFGCRIVSKYGELKLPAVMDSSMRPGVVWVSFYDSKVLINRVVAPHVDPVSKQPEYKVTAVRVEPW